jgi:hypothetical protein
MLMLSVDSKSRYNPFVVRALCEAGGHDYIMKTCAQTGRTALHFAVAQGREEAAQPELMLREFGGEELGLKQDHIGRTCLHLASEAELPESSCLIRTLVERGAGRELLMATCNGNCVGAATQLKGADSKLTCMHCAAQDRKLHSLVTLCELGGKELWLKGNFWQTPLFTACHSGTWRLSRSCWTGVAVSCG